MKRKYLSFVVCLAVAIIIAVVMCGCVKQEVPIEGGIITATSTEITYPSVRYITTIEECKIYGIVEYRGGSTVFFTKCPAYGPALTR